MARLFNARSSHVERWVVPAARELLIREACKEAPTKFLEEVAFIEMGQSPEGNSLNSDGAGIPFIGGPADLGLEFPATSRWTTAPTKLCKENDIIICVRATIGEPRWADGVYCLGRGVAGIRPKDENIDRKFLFRIIQANERLLFEKGTGTTFKTISKVHIAGILIPVLPPKIQKMIGDYLEWLNAHSNIRPNFDQAPQLSVSLSKVHNIVERIEAVAERVAAAQALRREASQEAVSICVSARNKNFLLLQKTGQPRRFDEVAEMRLGKMLSTAAKISATPLPYLRNANIQWDRLDLTSIYEMDFSENEKPTFQLKAGDILVCEGGDIGKSAIWNDELPECYYQKALHRIRVNPAVTIPRFILHHIFWAAEQNHFAEIKTQTTIPHLTGVKLKAYKIYLPPIEEQRRLVAYLDGLQEQISALRAAQEESQRELDALLPAVLDRAFKGEL